MGVTHGQERERSVYQLTNVKIYHSGDFMTSRAKDLFIHQEGDRTSELEVSLRMAPCLHLPAGLPM